MKYTLLLLLLNIWFNGHYMDYLGHFYQTVETEHGFAKGIIILESTQPSIISCVYICQGINANSIYQDGSCKCFRENDDMNERLISSSKYWQKLPHVSYYNICNIDILGVLCFDIILFECRGWIKVNF